MQEVSAGFDYQASADWSTRFPGQSLDFTSLPQFSRTNSVKSDYWIRRALSAANPHVTIGPFTPVSRFRSIGIDSSRCPEQEL